jgi:hypothetical protein
MIGETRPEGVADPSGDGQKTVRKAKGKAAIVERVVDRDTACRNMSCDTGQ